MKVRKMEVVQQARYLCEQSIINAIGSGYIRDWCYILHDKDVDANGNLKEPHWHIYLRLQDSTDSKYIAKLFGVEEQYINRVKGGWGDVLQYCIHENAPDKYQYEAEEVKSNFDFEAEKEKEKSKKNVNARLEEIRAKIVTGEIREYNYTEYINAEEYDQFKRHIENAYQYRADRLRSVERNMECVYITGESGTGKTTYAKEIAKRHNYSVFVSSSSNDVLDGYKGQECIILDDLRPSSMGLSDLLKFLDNNTGSSVKSRYKNKILECKLIVITSVLPLDTFFNNVFGNESEPIVQLKRRCSMLMVMKKETIDLSIYDEQLRDYIRYTTIANPVKDMFTPMTEAEKMAKFKTLLGDLLSPLPGESKHDVTDELVGQYDFKEILGDKNNPFGK